MNWVANARMYAVTADASAAWAQLFAWIARTSGVDLETIQHPTSLPMTALWTRSDLGAAFMCGRPWSRAEPKPVPIACPVPAPPRYEGLPRYMTDIVVRADSPFRTLEDTFGHRIGYTLEESQSGFNALRHHLLGYRSASLPTLYAESVGPLHTPRGVVAALLSGAIDAGPLDSYAFDLMRAAPDDPAHGLRVVATTAPAPIPFFVATHSCPPQVVEALRAAFLAIEEASELAAIRERLLLNGFSPVSEPSYDLLGVWDAEALAAGYETPK
ncbi:PhnD/SsuA/transferrin family substrate-binding protein [uncultured Bosea sp.]|uniref:phosphate/phosphite/phosphonate ABC transporter substrate-binding protein n=1 Tax=uncultured Bosea sp. TaxID=211457 RepID=UPI0025E770EF|nr:PhnD/SsuA/transferrin family substrate-binding protein [uncultured Bosea sp.]